MKIPTEHFGRRADRIDDLFKAVVTSVEYGFRKPHSGIFKHGMDLVGALAEHSFYVGDTFEADYVGSASVGMRGFLIDPDRRHDVKPSARLESLFDLEGRLRALEI